VFDTDTAVCSKAVQVFESVSHQANDPVVRVALLRTLDAAFEDDGEDIPEIDSKMNRGAALVGGDDARAVALIRNVVLESLVWKAGATAAAARYAAIVCLGTMLRGSLGNNSQTTNALPITQSALFAVMKENNSSLLPSIFSAMEEDYYAETRRAACYALRGVLATVGIPIGDERRRSIYPELLKRMDDSRDDIRIAASKCVETFFERCVSPDWDSTNCLYLLKPFVVHMDDGDEGVRDAVLRAVLAAAKVKPEVVVEVLTPALEQHRCVAHVQKGLEAARGK
jgi:dynein assembly factor 5